MTIQEAWKIEDEFRWVAWAMGFKGLFPDPKAVFDSFWEMWHRRLDLEVELGMELRKFYYV